MTLIRSSCAALVFLTAAAVPATEAQTRHPRFGLGGQVTILGQSGAEGTSAALGVRATLGLSRWISLDAEFNVAPHDDIGSSTSAGAGDLGLVFLRRRVEGFVGASIGVRDERVGVFVKARPGVMRLVNTGVECRSDVCVLTQFVVPENSTEFAFDVGGVLEFYPSARSVARFDIGDTIIRHRSIAPPCGVCTNHNLSVRLGFGLRF